MIIGYILLSSTIFTQFALICAKINTDYTKNKIGGQAVMFCWVALAMIGSYSVVTIGDSEGTTWAAVILFFAF